MRLSMGWNRKCGKMQRLLNFWGVALYGKRQRGAGGARPAGLWFAAAATRRAARFLLWLAELLSAPFRCARLSKSAGRKPASIGCLRAGSLETRVNSGLADRSAGNTRKCWAGGQPLRKCPFYAGFRAALWRGYGRCCRRSVVGAVVGLRPPAVVIQPAMRPSCAAGGIAALCRVAVP